MPSSYVSKKYSRKSRSRSVSPNHHHHHSYQKLKPIRNNKSPTPNDIKQSSKSSKQINSLPQPAPSIQSEIKPMIVVCSLKPNMSDSLFMDTSIDNTVIEKEGSVLSPKSTESNSKDKTKKHKHKSKKKHKHKHRSSSKSTKSSSKIKIDNEKIIV